jgi:uncharacterized protein (DUF58 family)
MKRIPRLWVTLVLSIVLLVSTLLLKYLLITGLILPLIIIFFFSLSEEEISLEAISVTRKVSRKKTEVRGDVIEVSLIIKNEGERIPIIEITDDLPNGCTVEVGSNNWILGLNQGEEVTLTYSIMCYVRGRHRIGPVRLHASDIFHLYSNYREISVFSRVTVVPALIKIRQVPVSRHRLLPETGSIPSLVYKGRDFDFQGVRDYQLGDEFRAINWRVTAKFNQLSTNEYSLDQAARVFIVFDHTSSAHRVLEEGVTAALSASEYLISLRNKVGFFAVGEFIKKILPTTGKRQLLRINEYLIDVQSSYPSFDSVFEFRLEEQVNKAIPPFSQVIFISPLHNRILTELLRHLVKAGHDVIHILPRLKDSNEFNPHEPTASKIANSMLILERKFILSRIKNLGLLQIHWFPTGPKFEALKIRRTR